MWQQLAGSLWGRFGFSDVMTIFRALGAKVELHHAGIMDLDEFVRLPRKTRDILVAVIVPKTVEKVVYLQPEKPVHRLSGADLRSCKESRRICSSGGGKLLIWRKWYWIGKVCSLSLRMSRSASSQNRYRRRSGLAAM